MQTESNILVGIDYSKSSENALREAARIADWNNGGLYCVHIIEDEVISIFRKQKDFNEPHVMKAALKHLEEYVDNILGSDHRCQCRLRSGHLFEEMFNEVKCRNTTLLALGSRGLKDREYHKVGMLSQRCIRKAPVEVLLIRKKQATPYQKIIACVDFSETSKHAAYAAADIAIQDNAQFELLHVLAPPAYPYGDWAIVPPLTPQYMGSRLTSQTEKLELMAEKLRASCGDHPVDATVLEGRVSHVIQSHINKTQADLVVMGTRGRTGFTSLLLGTKAEHIIHASPCSVLAVKPKKFHYELK